MDIDISTSMDRGLVYIARDAGTIFVDEYTENVDKAFEDKSFELRTFAKPQINPPILRDEVNLILNWIAQDADGKDPNRVALLYGKAGVGKSVVMHDVLCKLEKKSDYLVLGLKSDQIEFCDTDSLRRQMNLPKPIESVIKDAVLKKKRVVLLIDQIDALSLSLSSNRTPIRSIFKLITAIKNIAHVRVVISCRPYDLEYDPILNELKTPQKWELENFSNNRVQDILKENGLEFNIGEELLNFLGNPLHLLLYLKVIPHGKLRNSITKEVLYDELWRIYIRDIDENKISKSKVLEVLDTMVENMYKRQELSIHKCVVETEYNNELNYLLSNELLLSVSDERIQFFHQTMFDYVYARRFVEKNYDLLKELSSQHQGLFSRAAVKSILTFLREKDPWKYIQNLNRLLYDKDEEGKDKFRFHLKSLALSNMTFFDKPKMEELQLIKNKIFDNSLFMRVIFESIHSSVWLEAIWNIIENGKKWTSLKEDYKEGVLTMCHRTLWHDPDKVLDVIFNILSYGNDDDKKRIGNFANFQFIDCRSERIIKLYNEISANCTDAACIDLLKCIAKNDPNFVCDVFRKRIKELSAKTDDSLYPIKLNNQEESILRMMESKHHCIAIKLYVELLEIIMEATKSEFYDYEIAKSNEFSHFQRVSGGDFHRNFTEDVVNKLIDDFLKNIREKETEEYLLDFSHSNYECFVFIALYVYTEFPKEYVNEIYSIICKRPVLSNAPCWVEYQALEALKASFSYMTSTQQLEVIKKAECLTDKNELHIYKTLHQRRGLASFPICDLDLQRGKVLHALPKEILRKISWEAYQECLRIERKFAYKKNGVTSYASLKNNLPISSSTMCGWPSIGTKKAANMRLRDWYISMTKFKDNQTTDFKRPTLTGQCQEFKKVVSETPYKYLNFIKQIAEDKDIKLNYAVAGLEGLLDAKMYDEAEKIFCIIVDQLDGNVNSTYKGFNIRHFLIITNVFIENKCLPKRVFDFLCKAVLNIEECEVPSEIAKEKDTYNAAINQTRGYAAYTLVKCYKFEEYKEELFKTLENVATSASVYTRCAILLNMAVLNNLDKMRNIKLFKLLMHDYDVRLMSMPIHQYNPLIYFINYAIDDLMDFFKHATENPECYEELVIILWIAWSHNNHRADIKALLDNICDNSQTARLALVRFLSNLEDKLDEDAVLYITTLLNDKYNTPEFGDAYDGIFYHANCWPANNKDIIAQNYVNSSLSMCYNRGFIEFLASYAITEPIQALSWLERILEKKLPKDYGVWNLVTDVLIQSYNGIQSFNDEYYKNTLENAMDLMDKLMMNKERNIFITNFIQKLDEE